MSNITPINTKDLSGIALDWAVAKCEGATDFWFDTVATYWVRLHGLDRALHCGWSQSYLPCTDWSQGGLILERERIWVKERYENVWDASKTVSYESRWKGQLIITGQTYLEAGMRCHVANRLGDMVNIPNELLAS